MYVLNKGEFVFASKVQFVDVWRYTSSKRRAKSNARRNLHVKLILSGPKRSALHSTNKISLARSVYIISTTLRPSIAERHEKCNKPIKTRLSKSLSDRVFVRLHDLCTSDDPIILLFIVACLR